MNIDLRFPKHLSSNTSVESTRREFLWINARHNNEWQACHFVRQRERLLPLYKWKECTPRLKELAWGAVADLRTRWRFRVIIGHLKHWGNIRDIMVHSLTTQTIYLRDAAVHANNDIVRAQYLRLPRLHTYTWINKRFYRITRHSL